MDATAALMLVFRLLHISAGVAWAGSVFLFVVLIQPSAAAIGPASGPFMMELLGRRKLVAWLLSLGGVTVVAGLYLYWRDANGLDGLGAFVDTRYGLVLTIGAVSAIVAYLIGWFGTRPAARRLLDLAGQAASSGGPTPAVAQEIAQIQGRLKMLARVGLVFIALAVFAMASARYW
jgi:uncharacterized membrane protein